jgi:hypothetical protein
MIAVDDIVNQCELAGVDLSKYKNQDGTINESMIQSIIVRMQYKIQNKTGRRYLMEPEVLEKFNNEDSSFVLPYYPVKSIDIIEIDGQTVDVTNVRFNKKSGIVYLDEIDVLKYLGVYSPVYLDQHDINITYTPDIDPTIHEAKALCVDMVVDEMEHYTNPTKLGSNVSSVKEGDLQINYDTSKETTNDRQDFTARMNELVKSKMHMM